MHYFLAFAFAFAFFAVLIRESFVMSSESFSLASSSEPSSITSSTLSPGLALGVKKKKKTEKCLHMPPQGQELALPQVSLGFYQGLGPYGKVSGAHLHCIY